MEKFTKLGLKKELTDVLAELKFEIPTEIQEKTIPLVLEGRDVIGNAATGSGKTFAFASGIIQKTTTGKGVQALILTPTRELAEQIAKVIRQFAKKTNLHILEVYGGVDIQGQIRKIKNSDVIIGTPGRILDHLERRTLDLFELKTLVLDEADRMVDMGFLPDVERIIKQCPIKRQTLLFSATISPDVDYIAQKYMRSPEYISVEKYVDASKLKQYFYDAPKNQKFSLLVHLLKEEKSGTVIVFCNTRKNVDLVANNLNRHGIHAKAIHGGLTQNRRSRVIEQIHRNEAEILICTDVAARGLDIKDVTHVYNYDIPKTAEEYIHRVGRTARAGKDGMAISIVTEYDYDNLRRVMRNESLKIEQKELPEVERIYVDFGDKGYGRNGIGGDKRHKRQGREFGGRDNSRGRSPSRGSGRGSGRDSSRSSGRSWGGRSSGRTNDGRSSSRNSGRSYGRSPSHNSRNNRSPSGFNRKRR